MRPDAAVMIRAVPRVRPGLPWRRLAALALVASAALALGAPRAAEELLAVPSLARVTDTAGVLSEAGKRQLEDKLAKVEAKHGSQIAVIVVPSTKPEPIADYANRVGDAWKIGRKGVGDGVLIVVAVQDRQTWISVARALEGAIPDVTAARISREVVAPRVRQGDFAGGLGAAVDAIEARIGGEGLPVPAGVSRQTVDAGESVFALLVPFVLGGMAVGAVLRRVFGVPGALVAGAGTGALSGALLSSALLGGLAGVAVFLLALGVGRGGGRALGGRRGGFTPGGWGGGGGWSSGSGGWSSGGGGDFSGGGGGSSW